MSASPTPPSSSSAASQALSRTQFDTARLTLLHSHQRHVHTMLVLCIALCIVNLGALPLGLTDTALKHFNAWCALTLCAFTYFSLYKLVHLTNVWYALHQRLFEQMCPDVIDAHYQKDADGKPIYHTLNQPHEPWFFFVLPLIYTAFFIGLLAVNGGHNYWQSAFVGLF